MINGEDGYSRNQKSWDQLWVIQICGMKKCHTQKDDALSPQQVISMRNIATVNFTPDIIGSVNGNYVFFGPVRGQHNVPQSAENMRRSPNVAVMLGQRLRRWPNITATLGERFVFAVRAGVFCLLVRNERHTIRGSDIMASTEKYSSLAGKTAQRHETFSRCWFNVGPASQTMG